MFYRWDTDSDDWIILSRLEYAYDSHGQTLFASYHWNSDSAAWIGIQKLELSYTTDGRIAVHIEYEWDLDINDWRGLDRNESTYDSNGNRISRINYLWDLDTNDWRESHKYLNFFNSDGKEILGEHYHWNSELSDFELWRRTFYYWGINYAKVEDEILPNDIRIFPNPVVDILKIDSEIVYLEITLVDLSGKSLLITDERTIDLSTFKSGIYIVRIRDLKGDQFKTVKILKQE
jgi:hypothetical protein